MATVRQYDGDNAIERWRHCDDTTATVRYDYRIVAPSEPKPKEELVRAIQTFWNSHMTVEQCNMYIDHLFKVVPICIRMNGCATGDTPNRVVSRHGSRGKSIQFFENLLDTNEETRAKASLYNLQ
ncbi:hypothetical protein DPMN_160907 [Dreissena polymorpha]|uniref:Uncharacterized protein n=1 Tax=Dreissena polymorpha TaxID=45954 RepID=A0A9D4EMG3_DREPO|nr:hypothetical protein DPMN_160907 [Dreissena polymorpha]